MADRNIGGLPVMRGSTLVGIITESDLFRVFIELFGARQKGVRISMVLPNERGELAKVSAASLLCLTASLVVFLIFTPPVNRLTYNWSVLPDSWQALRARWEYSHAAGAGLNPAAVICLILSVLARAGE